VGDDEAGLLLSGGGSRFRRRTVVLGPGESRPSGDAEWRDAVVVVERGDVELECSAGGRRRFSGGAVLWLAGIDLRVLHNVGDDTVVLLVVSRRRDEGSHGPP
jgi:quercetin dioxygenase-like cupin family protein